MSEEHRESKGIIPLDYAVSDNAVVIDRGIRETINGIRFSILAMGLGLAKIKAKNLFRELKYKNMTSYIRKLCEDTGMDRSSIYRWLSIGEAYLKFRSELEQVGFCDSDGLYKLPFLERALETHQEQEVFDNIKTMSVREFTDFSKTPAENKTTNSPFVTVRNHRVFVDGRLAVKINRRLDKRSYIFFRKLIREGGRAMEEGEVILPVRLHSMDEAQRFGQAISRYISGLRKKA